MMLLIWGPHFENNYFKTQCAMGKIKLQTIMYSMVLVTINIWMDINS